MDKINDTSNHTPQSGPGKRNRLMIAVTALLLVLVLIFGFSEWSGNQIVSIQAVYSGPAQAGTVLDESNTGIQVTGRTRNRNTVAISPQAWTVAEKQVLSADVTSAVCIQYKNKTCELRVACTDSQTASICASYSGTTEAGTVISTAAEGFSVTAALRNGTQVDITDACQIVNGSVTLQENKTAALEIRYTDPFSGKVFSTTLDIICSTKTVRQIAAKYIGTAPEGEILDSRNPNFLVTATYDNGTVSQVQDWTVLNPSTLTLSKSSPVTISYGGQTTTVVVECSDFDPDVYRKNCSRLHYTDLVRYPDAHIGAMIRIGGRISQVYEGASSQYAYRIRVGARQYADIAFQGTLDKGKLIAGDYVTCYGTFMGIDQSGNGYPLIHAKIVER